MANEIYGLVAEFDTPGGLLKAAEGLRNSGYKKFETYSPFPIHGMDAAMGLKDSILGWIVFVFGATGLTCGFLLQTWVSVYAYKITVSGKPLFSFQAFVPVCFEVMILFSGLAAVFGMFTLNSLPELYHAMFNHPRFAIASSHGFFVSVEAEDGLYSEVETWQLLEKLGGKHIATVEA
jgi:hypothetical protein